MLRSAADVPFEQQIITIRIQELDSESVSKRPYEEDLTEFGLHADSAGDIPLVGDYIGLTVKRAKYVKGGNPEVVESTHEETFKIKSRFFIYKEYKERTHCFCNMIVEPVKDGETMGLLIKD